VEGRPVGELNRPVERRPRPSWSRFAVGFVAGLVLNFVLALNFALQGFGGSGEGTNARNLVVIDWLVTIGAFALLYRWHPWAAFGAFGAYAALFAVLLIGGGVFGPNLCFTPYGYRAPLP
jgi:hypothetical protein